MTLDGMDDQRTTSPGAAVTSPPMLDLHGTGASISPKAKGATMSIKILWMLKRKPGITPAQFREHYERSHAAIARKYVGHLLISYTRNYQTEAWGGTASDPAGFRQRPFDYDCITELEVADEAAFEDMGRIFGTPAASAELLEDELKFLDREATVMLRCDEVVDHDVGQR
jgi:hypothetical protein